MASHRANISGAQRPVSCGRDRTVSAGSVDAAVELAREQAAKVIQAALVKRACTTLMQRNPDLIDDDRDYKAVAALVLGFSRSTLGQWISLTSGDWISVLGVRRIVAALVSCGAVQEADSFRHGITTDVLGWTSDARGVEA